MAKTHAVTHACRAALVAGLSWVFISPEASQGRLQDAWDLMRTSQWVRHDTFEPSLVVCVFTASIFFFWLLDIPCGHWTRGWRRVSPDDMSAW